MTRTAQSLPHIIEVGTMLSGRVRICDGDRLSVTNPANESHVTTIVESSPEQVAQVVETARQAFVDGIWSQSAPETRQDVLRKTAGLIRESASNLASLDSQTTGLLFHRSTLRHTAAAADWFDYFADLLAEQNHTVFQTAEDIVTTVSREPAGVAALFTPWNIPLMAASLKLAAALAMGNSCVIKPSEQSPLGTWELAKLLHKAGLPEGVLHVVNGRGEITGSALAAHPDVDLISFTGGEHAGRAIATAAAQRFAKVTMELGGKSANIICDDADYDCALQAAIGAVYGNNGQACLAGSRILVQKKIADRFIADFVDLAKAIRLGDPFDERAEMGPQSSKSQMDRVLSFVEIAREDGGQILTGEQQSTDFDKGYYVDPVVALPKSNADRICQEEIFGPFASILTFDDDAEAVAIANDSRFGLAGYVWSGDQKRARGIASQLRTGYVMVNSPMVREHGAPFGGFGHSGLDREGGRWSVDFYSEAKTTVVRSDHA
ncbi:aldehyde dehydrogenase family protein [Parasphingorhabdus marina]|nr:aldehyde dehydrogenase family protein [Parasphingorhabdus marina]